MEQAVLLDTLTALFGNEWHDTREGGRQEMAERLAAHLRVDAETALGWIDELEAAGQLRFVMESGPEPDAMLEAARYGDADVPTSEGVWLIGEPASEP